MSQLNDTLQSNLALVVAAFGIIWFLLLVIVAIQAFRIRRLGRRLTALTAGSDGRSLEGVFADHFDSVFRVSADVTAVRERVAALEASFPLTFQRAGLVRFNPFQDTGGNQSFALAMLNGEDSGYVVSSLHSRSGTRVYAKAIKSGKCDTALSTEEQQAVDLAQSGPSAQAVAIRSSAPTKAAQPAKAAPPASAPQATTPLQTGAAMPLRPADAPMARRVASPAEPEIDGNFLERRLRGDSDGDGTGSIWGDRSRS